MEAAVAAAALVTAALQPLMKRLIPAGPDTAATPAVQATGRAHPVPKHIPVAKAGHVRTSRSGAPSAGGHTQP